MTSNGSAIASEIKVIVYSSWRTTHSNDEAVEMILRSARRNWERNITGAIWFGETQFFQILEGEVQPIDDLYKRIEKDSRHRGIELLLNRIIHMRTFNGWDSYVFDGPESTAIDNLARKYVTHSDQIWRFAD